MYPTILVPLEESFQAKRVLPYAIRLAAAGQGRIVLLQAIPAPDLRDHAEEMLGHIAEEIAPRTVRVEIDVCLGDPGQLIVETADRASADLIAMATDRWSDLDRWLNGSVVDWVLRHTSVPLFVVPPNCTREWSDDSIPAILTPLDGSTFAGEPLEPAAALARLTDSELVLLRAVEAGNTAAQAYLDEVTARLTSHGVRSASRVIVGDPSTAIEHAADERNIRMIAMATHGRTGLARLVLGSVATRVLQHASVPLVLVRPTALPTTVARDSRGPLGRSTSSPSQLTPSEQGGGER
jgi:nucleotide-binding universal stress UspA family protein